MTHVRLAICLSILLGSAHAIQAANVTYNVTAEIEFVDDPLNIFGGNFVVGDLVSGVLQYDLSLPDGDPDAGVGFYLGGSLADSFIEGSNGSLGSFQTTDFFDARIIDNDQVTNGDSAEFFASGDTTPSLLGQFNIDYIDLAIYLSDADGTAFTNDALPTDLNLADFEEATVVFSGEDDNIDFIFDVEARITSITRVPEPSSLLLSTLLTVMFCAGRRRRASR